MTCETTRAAMLVGDADWPSDLLAHLARCESCAMVAVELSLQQAPAIAVPPTFAADVARRARLEAPSEAQRLSGAAVGAGAAFVLIAFALAAVGTGDATAAVIPVAALLLACGEAIVLAAWTLHGDVVRARARP
jgi:hypothetical protein